MKKLSFPTVKLGNFICEVKEKVKNSGISQDNFTVYGVTNTDGITVTNNKASDDLGNYTVLRENQFAYKRFCRKRLACKKLQSLHRLSNSIRIR